MQPDLSRALCDLGPPIDAGETSKLLVVATTTGGAPYAALRTSSGWGPVALASGAGTFDALVGTDVGGLPILVGRQNDDTLSASLYDACGSTFPVPSQLFSLALTGDIPSVLGGSTVDVIFRGSVAGDERLFATHFDGAWHAATTLGNFLSTLPPVAVREGGTVHALFVGTDTNLYDGAVDSSGGTATQIVGTMSDKGVGGVVGGDGTTYVVFKGTDTNLYWVKKPAGGSYTMPLALCTGQTSCLINSSDAPVVALDDSGAPVTAWVGGDGITYTSRLSGSQWSPALAATTEATALLPAVAPGVDGASLELVYVRMSDGKGRHTRLIGGVFAEPVDLPNGPLGTAPSLSLTSVR